MFIHPINSVSTGYNSKTRVKNKQIKTLTPSFKSDKCEFDYNKKLQDKLAARPWYQKILHRGIKTAEKELALELKGYNAAQNQLVAQKDKALELQKKITEEKEKRIKDLQTANEALAKNLELSKSDNEKTRIIEALNEQIEENNKKRIEEEIETKEEIEKIKNIQLIKSKREAGKGWDKIAGYDNLKNRLEEIFINKIAQEQYGDEVSMPNCILLYGQSGTGKTRFSKAFAEEAKCDFQKIDMMQDDDDIIDELQSKLIAAKKLYYAKESNKKRTIILLDDFNSIAKLSNEDKLKLNNNNYEFEDTNVGRLISLLKNCEEKYKTTIIMTTNFPRKIDSKLLDKNIVPHQIFIGPPTPRDAAEILKYHAKNLTNQDINYVDLGMEISKAIINDTAYSAQGIVNIVEHAKNICKNAQITEDALRKAIKQVPPNIDKKMFNSFLDDMGVLITGINNEIDE